MCGNINGCICRKNGILFVDLLGLYIYVEDGWYYMAGLVGIGMFSLGSVVLRVDGGFGCRYRYNT